MSVETVEQSEASQRANAVSSVPWALVSAVLLVLTLAERYSKLYARNVVDDAMTSMQYAKQLALGNGLVFNVGERVEGYTNFLWVVAMTPVYALCHWLGFDFPQAVVHLNILIAVAVVAIVYVLASRLWGKNHLATWAAVGLCTADNSFTVWAGLGLETHFLALFMLLALWSSHVEQRRRWLWLGLALLGAHLTRPDAGLFCAVLLANELVESALLKRRGSSDAARRRAIDAVLAGLLWLLAYAAYFYWRYRYYGALLPNTYYLKLDGEIDGWQRGLEYLRSFLHVRAFLPLGALLALLQLRNPMLRGLLAYNLLHTMYVVYVGGDFFPGHRFFVPEIPQLALLFGAGIAGVWQLLQRPSNATRLVSAGLTLDMLLGAGIAGLIGVLGVVYQRGLVLGPLELEVRTWGDNLTRQSRLFRWLREVKPAGASIATCLIGHTGFYSEARVIDICGVIDPVTARRRVPNFGKGKAGHEKLASDAYVLGKQPTYVSLNFLSTNLWEHGYYLDAELPDATFEGLWVKDALLARGRYLPETRVGFESGKPHGWLSNGSAFESWPSRGHWLGQGELVGASGALVNSYHPALGTAATGTLRSAPFQLLGDQLLFRVAGGQDSERLRVDLYVDGARLYSTTGKRGDFMSRRAWDIRAARGKSAVLEVVDQATQDWGYLAVDELVQWQEH